MLKAEHTTKELFVSAKNGDKAAFERLYTELLTPVFRYIYARVRNKELAEDIAQTVFIKAFETLPRHQSNNTSPLAYFLTAARNHLIDYWRKKKDITTDFSAETTPEPVSYHAGPHENLVAKEQEQELFQAMQNLNEEQREVLILKYMNGQSAEEIALIIGKSNDAVRQIQSRAIKQLRLQLQQTT